MASAHKQNLTCLGVATFQRLEKVFMLDMLCDLQWTTWLFGLFKALNVT